MNCNLKKLTGLLVALFLWGCGPAKEALPKVYPTTGIVNYKGKPVEGATVIFAGNGEGEQSAAGRTGADGKFQLTTFAPQDGCTEGRKSVVILKSESPTEPDPKTGQLPETRNLLPLKYSDTAKSGLEATIEAGKENHFEFNLD